MTCSFFDGMPGWISGRRGLGVLVCGFGVVGGAVPGFASAALGQTGEPRALPPGAVAAGAVVSREAGIEFVTVTAAGNTPWAGNGTVGDRAVGRGGVDHDYRIGRYEITTAQWVPFMNAAFDRPANDRIPFMQQPGFWGATAATPSTPGGQRWTVPAGNEMRLVGNIS